MAYSGRLWRERERERERRRREPNCRPQQIARPKLERRPRQRGRAPSTRAAFATCSLAANSIARAQLVAPAQVAPRARLGGIGALECWTARRRKQNRRRTKRKRERERESERGRESERKEARKQAARSWLEIQFSWPLAGGADRRPRGGRSAPPSAVARPWPCSQSAQIDSRLECPPASLASPAAPAI